MVVYARSITFIVLAAKSHCLALRAPMTGQLKNFAMLDGSYVRDYGCVHVATKEAAMSEKVIPKREPTPGPWKYGVREDGSMWISIGDPMRKHSQFDWYGFEEDLELACRAPELEAKVAELEREVERLKGFEWMYKELCK
jgi:hypothetical protein